MRCTLFPLFLALFGFVAALPAQDVDRLDRDFLQNARIKAFHPPPHDLTNGNAHSRFGIAGIDSIPNFNGQYFADGYDANGNPNRHWYTNTLGNPPQMGRTTVIGAPIQPVNVELDDENGNLRYVNGQPLISTVSQFIPPVLASPVFSNFSYSSSEVPTQFSDAIQRAEFYASAKPDWHTLLAPRTLPVTTIRISQSATCPSGPNDAGCNYQFALNAGGTCCAFILVNTESPFLNNLVNTGALDINANAITTRDISTFLFPNVFLFSGDLSQCCILGFHEFFFAGGVTPEPIWVFDFASWITPGLLGPSVSDVMGLSHEITEIYNDPFLAADGVHDLTPWWLAPNGECQDILETGDPIEGLPGETYPITAGNGFTYHPQNEALMQWFEFKQPSDAIEGAYSYPNTNLLQSPSTLQAPGCP